MSVAGARAAGQPCARAPLSSRQPGPLRLRSSVPAPAAAAAQQQRQQQRRPPGRRGLAAAAAGGSGGRQARAASGDLGDEFAELLERREELLRLQEDGEEGLASEEDEELADITDRLLKFGYLEDTGELGEEAEEEEVSTSEDEEAAALYTSEDEEAAALYTSEEEEAASEADLAESDAALVTARRGAADLGDADLDSIIQQAGQAELRGAGAGAAAAAEGAEDQEGEEGEEAEEGERYPEPPQRSYRLPELLRLAGYDEEASQAPDVEIRNILTCNSITPQDGSLFVCTPSTDGRHDGHAWADAALDQGAVAVLADRPLPDALLPVVVLPDLPRALGALAAAFYEHPSRRMRTVGVVGSFGKTTTAWLARGMFEETGERCGMIGTIEYAIAEDRLTEEGAVWEADEEDVTLTRECSTPFHVTPYKGKYPQVPTTPDALHLHKALAGAADRGAATCIVELDPASLADGRADLLDLDVLVYTNTFPDGEAAAGGPAAHRAALLPLVDRLSDPDRQRAIISVDDALGQELAARLIDAGATVLQFSTDNRGADIYPEKIKSTIWETEVLVHTPLGRLQVITPLLGRQAAANVLAAVGAGMACGVPLRSVVAGIEAVDLVPGRSEVVDEGQQFSVVVDSANTPEQLSRLLDAVKDAGAKRVLLVLGCPGTTSKEQRAAMMQMAHFKADAVYVTNDSPGAAWPSDIVTDMVAGLPPEVQNRYSQSSYPYLQDPHRQPHWYTKFSMQYQSVVGVYIVEDRFQAIRVAIGMAAAKEVVVVAGKGHVDYQEYWDGVDWEKRTLLKSWFDDRVECRNALSKLPYLNSVKDLKRDYLPWTRYPEERDILEGEGLQASAGFDAWQ